LNTTLLCVYCLGLIRTTAVI